ncbi:Flavonol 4'-sulfotransferase [Dichanthelium oligosanthes]|uniref:Sulfotransferase n=1 Tax=Dichanthelium oligosanthes TaxID=888268 RepID=A0A1E5WD91_9POAL|nr:Flavonol 4'-sulfotransferase [Dichanthelium oligosanthes]
MPLSLLPNSKLVLVVGLCTCAEIPKDAFVSRWHFENEIRREYSIDLETSLSMFAEAKVFQDMVRFGSMPRVRTGERASHALTRFFFFFSSTEDMMSEPVKHVMRLATFLGVPFGTKEEEHGIPKVVRLCSFEKLRSLHGNKKGDVIRRGNLVVEKSVFFRKGKVGDWVNHMSEEMGRKLDCIVEEKLKGSGLVL